MSHNPLPPKPDMRYTLCFLTRGDQVLMLHRRHAPNRGLWNGVGGKLMPGESPVDGCLREVREETGFRPQRLRFLGILTWEGFETPPGGLYIFTAPAPQGEPIPNGEGTLRWQPREWVLSSPEVVDNIHIFGPAIFQYQAPRWWHVRYQDGILQEAQASPLPAWVTLGGRRACCP